MLKRRISGTLSMFFSTYSNYLVTRRRRRASANMATLKIRGKTSQINKVTMEVSVLERVQTTSLLRLADGFTCIYTYTQTH